LGIATDEVQHRVGVFDLILKALSTKVH
jgi:hypothetical protein